MPVFRLYRHRRIAEMACEVQLIQGVCPHHVVANAKGKGIEYKKWNGQVGTKRLHPSMTTRGLPPADKKQKERKQFHRDLESNKTHHAV